MTGCNGSMQNVIWLKSQFSKLDCILHWKEFVFINWLRKKIPNDEDAERNELEDLAERLGVRGKFWI